MRAGWATVKLGDICTLLNGRAYSQNELLREGKYPVLRVGNFFSNKDWYYSDLELDPHKYCDDGDLLYAWSASFGPKIWHGGKVIYHYHIWKTELDATRVTKRFLYYWFDWDSEKIKFDQGAGTTMTHVTKGAMENRTLALPPITEQNRIVAILDEAFAGIDTAIANTEKNLANAGELFDSYLQQAFRHQEGWEERTLQQVSRLFGRGKSRHRPRNDPSLYDGPYPFIQTGEVRNCNHVILESSQTYNEFGLAQSKLWPRGTICITIAANIAETGILGFDACFPDSIIGMVPDENKTTSDFVEYLLQATKAQLKAQGKGSAQDNINVATFENRRFLFPPLARQREIADTLNALSDRVQQLEAVFEQKLVRLAELKQAILLKAFAGELTARSEEALRAAAE